MFKILSAAALGLVATALDIYNENELATYADLEGENQVMLFEEEEDDDDENDGVQRGNQFNVHRDRGRKNIKRIQRRRQRMLRREARQRRRY